MTTEERRMVSNEILQARLKREQQKVATLEQLIEEKVRALFVEQEQHKSLIQYMQNVVETMTSALFVVDEDLGIEMVNSAASSLSGINKELLLKSNLTQFLSMKEISRLTASRGNSSSTELKVEAHFKTSTNELVPVLLTASIMPAGRDSQEKLVCVAHDMREQKSLQSQILQSQKLESVGQLAAGVAHELNTPIQYIHDNVGFMEKEFVSIASMLESLRSLISKKTPGEQIITRFEEMWKEYDLDYLLAEIPLAAQQTLEGAESVAKIVKAMKEFSHPGSSERIAVDINRAMQSVATVSKNEWKYVAELKLNLAENLPHILCYAGELNQAILNLIINASHAIEVANKSNNRPLGCITIETTQDDRYVIINIRDTGTGIPNEIRDRIFEPFFTTKDVGLGTGQGLTLAHRTIVMKHQGELTFESEVGKGTTFIVKLPKLVEEKA